jgi:serine protease Do
MVKHISVLFCVVWVQFMLASSALATPSPETLQQSNAQVLRVQVKHKNGKQGLGSAVIIGQNQVVTSCHVISDALDVEVIMNGVAHVANQVKPDWHHDLCILTVANLIAPIAKIGASNNLKYEAAVFTVGYPDKTTEPVNTFGVVTGIFPLDDSVVIRATSAFRLGASGGGVFDDSGNLIGIITLKSRGTQAFYYYMPVEWVQALMQKAAQTLGTNTKKPFWAAALKQRPYFMQVVQPYVSHDWQSLQKLSLEWVKVEPKTAESWFYLAISEYETQAYDKAEEHFNKVLVLNRNHRQAIEYLQLIAEDNIGEKDEINQLAKVDY